MMQFDKYRAWFVLFACSVAVYKTVLQNWFDVLLSHNFFLKEGVKVESERERESEEGYSPYVNWSLLCSSKACIFWWKQLAQGQSLLKIPRCCQLYNLQFINRQKFLCNSWSKVLCSFYIRPPSHGQKHDKATKDINGNYKTIKRIILNSHEILYQSNLLLQILCLSIHNIDLIKSTKIPVRQEGQGRAQK